jgi:hypothetical protein
VEEVLTGEHSVLAGLRPGAVVAVTGRPSAVRGQPSCKRQMVRASRKASGGRAAASLF